MIGFGKHLKHEMTERVKHFSSEPNSQFLTFQISFKSIDGETRVITDDFMNPCADTPETLRESVLQYMTPFVRKNWFRLEVITPVTNNYGRLEGWNPHALIERDEMPVAVSVH